MRKFDVTSTVGPKHRPPCCLPKHDASTFVSHPWDLVQRKGCGLAAREVGVQIEYDVVHLQTSLVQFFVVFQLNCEEVVQIIFLLM
jgi:hypothetical protein